MDDPSLELAIAGDGDDPVPDALQVLEEQFDVEIGGPTTIQRMWLDTFDWRLQRAGLVLAQSRAAKDCRLTLSAAEGERLTCQIGPVDWPGFVDRLPASALRDRVGSVAGIRALLPTAEATSVVREVQVRNADIKTVTRIVLDRPVDRRSQFGKPVAHLSIRPVRGYRAQSERVATLLSTAPGVTTGAPSIYEWALLAAGRTPHDKASDARLMLSPAMSGASAIATVLETFLIAMEANVSGVVTDIDTEFLHDFRVAVRRTRATLKLTGDVLPDELAERFAVEFKWLGDLTTPTRDLDVFLLGFREMAGSLQAADAAELEPLHGHLVRRRSQEFRRLVRGLRSRRFERLISAWRSGLADVIAAESSMPEPVPTIGITAADLARKRVWRTYRRVVKHGSAITADSPAEQLHTLRKRCKELRYLLEIFSSLQDRSAHRRMLRELKALQDCLGDFQDGSVQREAIETFAAEMMVAGFVPAETVLAMGELSVRVDESQRRARSEFADRFAHFTSAKNRKAAEQLMATTAA